VPPDVDISSTLYTCPFDVAETKRSAVEVQNAIIQFPKLWAEGHAWELLEWFAQAFASASSDATSNRRGQGAELCLPSSFTKDERKEWHHFADRYRLQTQSTGTGSSRHLSVLAHPPDSLPAGELPEVSKQAKQIWRWCQSEGGSFWRLSQGEIACMLSSPEGLPENLEELCAQRRKAQELIDALSRGDGETSLTLLRQAEQQGAECMKRLVWHKDVSSGNFPIHVAVRKGLVDVVQVLAGMPNVLTQKDRNWLTVFDICEDQRTSELLCRLRAAR